MKTIKVLPADAEIPERISLVMEEPDARYLRDLLAGMTDTVEDDLLSGKGSRDANHNTTYRIYCAMNRILGKDRG